MASSLSGTYDLPGEGVTAPLAFSAKRSRPSRHQKLTCRRVETQVQRRPRFLSLFHTQFYGIFQFRSLSCHQDDTRNPLAQAPKVPLLASMETKVRTMS